MTGKTHLAVGILTSVAVTRPQTIQEIVLCAGTAAVGALISDVDVTRSKAKNRLDHIVGMIVGAVVLMVLVNALWGIDLYGYLDKSSSIYRMISGALIFIGICIFGERTPHRSFMHSAVGAAALCFAVSVISFELLPYFLPAMISHIVIDMLNSKKVRVLYPLEGGIALDICRSDGLINKILFYAASALSCGMIAILITGTLR